VRTFDVELPGARACFSTRLGGVSEGSFESLNLGVKTDDLPERVAENRRRLSDHVGLDTERVARLWQVHGAELHEWIELPGPPGWTEIGRELHHADAQFDALWARTRTFSPTTNVRSAAFINWHCFGSPARTKKLIACFRAGVLVGFAVIMPQPMRGGRLLGWQCVDLWTDPVTAEATPALVADMIDLALKAKADLLELPNHGGTVRSAALRAGFLPRKPRDLGEMVLGPASAVAALAGPEAYLCSLQGDTGL
jgi:hypothetical protein